MNSNIYYLTLIIIYIYVVCDMYIFNIIVEAMKLIILLEKVTEIDCSRINYYTSSHVQFLISPIRVCGSKGAIS